MQRMKEAADDLAFRFNMRELFEPGRALSSSRQVLARRFGTPSRPPSGQICGLPHPPPSDEQLRAGPAARETLLRQRVDAFYEPRKKALQREAELVTHLNAGELQKRQATFDTERNRAAGAYAQSLINAEQLYGTLGQLAQKRANARVAALTADLQAQQAILNAKIPGSFMRSSTRRRAGAPRRLEAQIATTLLPTDRELLSIDNRRIDA